MLKVGQIYEAHDGHHFEVMDLPIIFIENVVYLGVCYMLVNNNSLRFVSPRHTFLENKRIIKDAQYN